LQIIAGLYFNKRLPYNRTRIDTRINDVNGHSRKLRAVFAYSPESPMRTTVSWRDAAMNIEKDASAAMMETPETTMTSGSSLSSIRISRGLLTLSMNSAGIAHARVPLCRRIARARSAVLRLDQSRL
jgi:hypothetical protein